MTRITGAPKELKEKLDPRVIRDLKEKKDLTEIRERQDHKVIQGQVFLFFLCKYQRITIYERILDCCN